MAGQLSWLEHTVHTRGVAGSNPVPATLKRLVLASLFTSVILTVLTGNIFMAGQLSWLEHTVHTRGVAGSNPVPATLKRLAIASLFSIHIRNIFHLFVFLCQFILLKYFKITCTYQNIYAKQTSKFYLIPGLLYSIISSSQK